MSYIRTSFLYDPIRQGYDTNLWRTISGAPAVVNGRLSVDNAVGLAGECIHYVDFLKGDISFDVNVPAAPVEGTTRRFGVSAPNTSAYIRFSIGSTFQCQVSDGTNTWQADVSWNSAWTGENTIFRIRWESGCAKFFVNGTKVFTMSDMAKYSTGDVFSVPCGPLSLYLYDGADTSMTVGDINVRGTQCYVLNPKTSDTTPTNPTGNISLSQSVTVTENVAIGIIVDVSKSDAVTVSDNISIRANMNQGVNDSVTISEDAVASISVEVPLYEEVTASEDVSLYITEQFLESYDDVAVSEDATNTVVDP